MANLHNIPEALQLLIQDEKENILRASLRPNLGFRSIATPVPLNIRMGESLTMFRENLLAPNTTPRTPSTFNGDLDNGMTPKQRAAEAFTLSPQFYSETMNLNLLSNTVALIGDYAANIRAMNQQAFSSRDLIARNKLMAPYLGGETFCTTTAGSDTSIAVDDVTGFETKMVNGEPVAVSGGANALSITINDVANTVTGVTVDGTNTSRNPYGRSGVLTLGTATADTQGHIILAADRPRIIKPRSSGVERASRVAITTGDLFTMRQVRDGVSYLRNQGVPTINGRYECHLSQDSMSQLFEDTEFKNLVNGGGLTQEVIGDFQIYTTLDVRFVVCHMHVAQEAGATPTTVKQLFPILVGDEALLEGDYANMQELQRLITGSNFLLHDVHVTDGVSFVDRSPLDRLGLNMAQSWMFITDYAVPTDSLITTSVIPTCSNSRLKRAVVLAHSAT
jgi:hypothetical protein